MPHASSIPRLALLTALLAAPLAACQSTKTATTNQPSTTANATTPAVTDDRTFTHLEKIDRVTLASGLIIEELRRGSGELCIPDTIVKVRYTCRVDGATTDFDSTGPDAVEYDLRNMIRGWQEGIPGMLVGGVRRLTIPSELAYGSRALIDADGAILAPANSTLVYEIELICVK